MNFKTVSVFLFLFLISVVSGQSADTVLTRTDSTSLPKTILLSDSTAASDSVKKADDISSVIYASASDSVSFSIARKKMRLYGEGKLTYEKSKLEGGKILVDFSTNQVEAFGIKDTSDTTGNKFLQTPVLAEGADIYKGRRLKYNFKTKQGFISLARNDTKKDSRYEGAKVKKIDESTYYIEDGLFTTCESDTPHTHFKASRMKIIDKKIIVAEWIWMYIAQIPMPVPLPFGVFPMQSGRRSGIIVPTFTSSFEKGQIIREFGYYWAINDYMDLKLTGDYYTRGGYAAAAEYRYKKRYQYDGTVSLKFSDQTQGEKGDPDYRESWDWRLYLRHNQKLDPTSSLSANLNFQSGSFNQNNSNNAYDGLKQNISSSATYSKRWEGASITASYSRYQNLVTDDISQTLPDVRFSKSRFYPFASSESTPDNKSWYEEIAVTYNSHLSRKQKNDEPFDNGIQHQLNISAAPKAGYINISPTLNYTERWYDKYTQQELQEDSTDATGKKHYSIRRTDRKGFNRVVDFSLGVSMSTKLYGMLNLNSMGIEAIRHTITPSISYSYRPDFSKEE
ncbi:MAG: putative LPS assembly protein LptD, partial [Rhodothermaceae bacterium]